jgi:hypothetical protein
MGCSAFLQYFASKVELEHQYRCFRWQIGVWTRFFLIILKLSIGLHERLTFDYEHNGYQRFLARRYNFVFKSFRMNEQI